MFASIPSGLTVPSRLFPLFALLFPLLALLISLISLDSGPILCCRPVPKSCAQTPRSNHSSLNYFKACTNFMTDADTLSPHSSPKRILGSSKTASFRPPSKLPKRLLSRPRGNLAIICKNYST